MGTTVVPSDNDLLVEWLHEHADHLDDPFSKGRVRAAADELERLIGIVLCLTRRWPDCNATNCGQPCAPAALRNPNQGRGADLVRTEGEGGSRSAADAGIGGAHDASDGRVGQDHAGAPSELKPATDGDRASDPPGATHTPSLLDRRRAKDIGLMKSAQRRTLDDEGICTRCGAPDVHCMCGDVDAQIDGSGGAS